MASEQSLTTPFLSPSPPLSDPPPPHSVVTVRSSFPLPSPFAFFRPSRPLSVPDPSPVDPFRNHSKSLLSSPYESLRTLLCIPLALLRLLIFVASLLIGFAATKLALGGWKDREPPLPFWRRRIMWVTRLCARLILFSFGYQWIARKGKPAPREMAPIVVSNHISFIEPIFYFYELFPTMVASQSHDTIPFVGTIIRAMQVIYVNRFDPSSRKNAVSEIKGCKYRERLLVIAFLVCYFFRKEQLPMEGRSSPFNSVHLFLDIVSNQWSYTTLMYTSISPGDTSHWEKSCSGCSHSSIIIWRWNIFLLFVHMNTIRKIPLILLKGLDMPLHLP